MTIALPTSESQNNLLHKLTKQWNTRISSPKFNSINPWIRAYINDAVEGYPCNRKRYWIDYNECSGKAFQLDFVGDKTLAPLTFEYWSRRQPDNTANMEYNAVLRSDYEGHWNDVAKTSLQHTVCEYNIGASQGLGLLL